MRHSILMLLLLGNIAHATTYYVADESFTPAGDNANDGLSAANPKPISWCDGNTNLNAGDVCIYAAGNYGGDDLVLTGQTDGVSGNIITHRCEGKYTCIFDKIGVIDSDYVELINFKTDSNYYDSSKSYSNPRVRVYGSHHIWFTSWFMRAEPQRCADGWEAFNGGPGACQGTSYSRFNDLFYVGNGSASGSDPAYAIALRSSDTYGETILYGANHAGIELHDDGLTDLCSTDETNYYIGGTPDTPLVMKSIHHNIIANKGTCSVLIEHVDFQASGTGRGDLNQPDGSTDEEQSGGSLHGSSYTHYAVRFSTFSETGSGTSVNFNTAGVEIGLFGGDGDHGSTLDQCVAHNSFWRTWGAPVLVAGATTDEVDDIVVLNIAADEMWYGNTTFGSYTPSDYNGAFLARSTTTTGFPTTMGDIYFDGIVFDPVADTVEGDNFMYTREGVDEMRASTDCPSSDIRGDTDIGCGSSVTYSNTQFFEDPSNRDFTINTGDPASLTGSAVAIAQVTSVSGSGTTVSITANRAHCFFDDLDGIRSAGDVIDIGGDEVTVTAVDYENDTLTFTPSITWAQNDNIRFVVDGAVHDDIGAISSTQASPSPGPQNPGPGRNLKRASM